MLDFIVANPFPLLKNIPSLLCLLDAWLRVTARQNYFELRSSEKQSDKCRHNFKHRRNEGIHLWVDFYWMVSSETGASILFTLSVGKSPKSFMSLSTSSCERTWSGTSHFSIVSCSCWSTTLSTSNCKSTESGTSSSWSLSSSFKTNVWNLPCFSVGTKWPLSNHYWLCKSK